MATTTDDVCRFLGALDLRYKRRDDHTVSLGFGDLDHYRDPDGDPHLGVIVRLEESGEYVKVFAPTAWRVPADVAGPVLQVCAMVQWRTKLVQFEYDADDGELRPIVEFPLEDAPLTERQLARCVSGLVQLIDTYAPSIDRAIQDGLVEVDDAGEAATVEALGELLSGFPPDVLADALRRADDRRRGA